MARFRIRTPQGQELSFASIDVFREFVRSGDLTPEDIVYDAETGEWASARTHPLVLEIELEAEEAAATASQEASHSGPSHVGGAVAEPSADEPPESFTLADIGLDLAPAPSQLTPAQETTAFMAKLEAERVADLGPEGEGEVPVQAFTMEQAPPEPAPMVAGAPARPLEPAPRSFRQERIAPTPSRPAPSRTKTAEKPSVVWRYAPFAILMLVLAGAGVYFGPELFSPPASEGSGPTTGPVTPAPGPAPTIAATDDALRGRARERFLTSTQTLLRGLEPISASWLSGRYLAGPSDYAHVRNQWETYLTTIREVRAGDDERYRAAYERALDDAGIQEPARTERLARGMAEFQARAAARNAHYDHVERLATVAMSGHDALIAAEGSILYEPATGPAVSSDPVIEAVGRTPADQALLEEILDAILAELRGEGGAGNASNVREWVYGGLLDAVAN
jgi:hypothetical protein